MFLCLSMGFEGKYRVMERGAEQLEAVRDGLYRQIRHVRGDRPLVQRPAVAAHPVGERLRVISATWIAVFAFSALLAMYSGFAWVLLNERNTVLQLFQPVAPDQTRSPL